MKPAINSSKFCLSQYRVNIGLIHQLSFILFHFYAIGTDDDDDDADDGNSIATICKFAKLCTHQTFQL